MVFSKSLKDASLSEIAVRLREMGIEALDLTVRSGGHIEPQRVAEELPRAAQVLAQHGVQIGMITTNITDARHPETASVLRAARDVGVGFYKLGYYLYGGFGTLRRDREEVAAKVRELAQLNREIGIVGGYHNHSDNFLGASLWDIDFVLRDIAPDAIGLYFDPAHASIEGGAGGWRQGLDLLQERVVMVAVKDYEWIEKSGANGGGRRFKVRWCPLQDGNVHWSEVLEHLRAIGYDGPLSLHSEYQGAHSFRDLSTPEIFAQTARDAEVLRQWMRAAAPQTKLISP